ncbi:CBS domain-containing protein [Streptomyces sp. NPDC059071]|uniref:CBS domain-containing protein n=1 Tax=unclassified Streptomyces TaxID=2593676 RepID=UPI003649544C
MRHRRVADLMTPTAVSVVPGTTFKEIARLLDEFDITAVCVVDESNRPLGVVSEADLVVEDVVTHTLGLSPSALSVEVVDGRVTLSGTVRRRSLVPVFLRLCNSVDGVVGVVDRLTYEDDDLPKEGGA